MFSWERNYDYVGTRCCLALLQVWGVSQVLQILPPLDTATICTYCSSRSSRQIPGRNGNGTPGFRPSWKSGHRSLHCDTEKTHKGSSGRTRRTCWREVFQVFFRSFFVELRNQSWASRAQSATRRPYSGASWLKRGAIMRSLPESDANI